MSERLTFMVGAMLFLFILTTAVLVVMIASFFFQTRNRLRTRLVLLALFLLNLRSLLAFFARRPWEAKGQWSVRVAADLKGWPVIAVLTIAYLVVLIRGEFIFRKNEITPSSIKESLDHLPDGALFAAQNGRVLLVNEAMLRIGRLLQEHRLVNADAFWNDITGGQETDEKVVTLPDGTAHRFRRVTLATEEQPLVRITATDLTSLYRLTEELQQRNRELTAMNERLRQYRVHVDTYTREKEHLQIKSRIHRETGQLLLATRHAVLSENEDTMQSVLRGWKLLERSMREEPEAEWSSQAKQQLQRAADAAGAKLMIDGIFPEEKEIISLLMGACAEATINAVRHADARVITMKIRQDGAEYCVEFTNDGRNPEHATEPAGGLASLKNAVEGMGGVMEIISEPEFLLRLKIPEIKAKQ